MSSIATVSDRCLRILNGGNIKRDSQFHMLDIQYMVRDTAAKLIKGEWFSERNEGGKDIDARYVVPFGGIAIKVDGVTKENYIDLPFTSYIRLPYGAGIRSVRPETTGTKRTKQLEMRAFIPIPARFVDIYFQLPAGSLEGQVGWMVRRNKIYFTKKYEKTLLEWDVKTVAMDVVTTDPAALAETDELPLSSELIQQLITEVVTIFKQGKPEIVDQINDENPNVTKAE